MLAATNSKQSIEPCSPTKKKKCDRNSKPDVNEDDTVYYSNSVANFPKNHSKSKRCVQSSQFSLQTFNDKDHYVPIYFISIEAPICKTCSYAVPRNLKINNGEFLDFKQNIGSDHGNFSQPAPSENLDSYNDLPHIEDILGCRFPTVRNIPGACRNKWASAVSFTCHHVLKNPEIEDR